MECWESVGLPLTKLHRKNGDRFVGPRMDFQLKSDRARSRYSDFIGHMQKYSARNLTNAEDSYNAFKGIVKGFKDDLQQPINSFWGLPIHPKYPIKSFAYALTWVHKGEQNPRGAFRRSKFPSWSFVGWRGALWLDESIDPSTHFEVSELDIRAMTTNEEYELTHLGKRDFSNISTRLCISGWTLNNDYWKDFIVSSENAMYFKLSPTSQRLEPIACVEGWGQMKSSALPNAAEIRRYCLLIGSTNCPISNFRYYYVMVVQASLEGVAERVGMLRLTACPSGINGIKFEYRRFNFDSGSV
jgi:hypothetical protein